MNKIPDKDKKRISNELMIFLISLAVLVFSLCGFFSLLMPGLFEKGRESRFSYSLYSITFGDGIFQNNPILIGGYFCILLACVFLVIKAKSFKYIVAAIFYLASLVIFSCVHPFSTMIQDFNIDNLSISWGIVFIIIFNSLSLLGSVGLFILSRLILVPGNRMNG